MVALCIILGIILLIALVLNIRAHVHVEYEDRITAYAKWAFVKIPLYPRPEKELKPKKEKEKNEKEKKPEEEKEPKEKGPNPLKTLYENEQLDGILDILKKILNLIGKFGHRFVNSFVIDEMFLDITVSRDDAASTAEEYGKVSQKVFPIMGAVCANCNVRKYSINISPDYIGKGYNEYAFSLEISLNPRKLINAVLAFAFGAVFKVGIRLIRGIKKKDAGETDKGNNDGGEENPDNSSVDNGMNVQMPVKQVEYGKYDDGTVSEPEIYVDNKD